jgi:hypothetical protein
MKLSTQKPRIKISWTLMHQGSVGSSLLGTMNDMYFQKGGGVNYVTNIGWNNVRD